MIFNKLFSKPEDVIILQEGIGIFSYCGWIMNASDLKIYFYNVSGIPGNIPILDKLQSKRTCLFSELQMAYSIEYSDALHHYQKIRNRNNNLNIILYE